jgi:hypothetical protein
VAAWQAERRQRSGGGSFPSAWRWGWKHGGSGGGGGSAVVVIAAQQHHGRGKQRKDGVCSAVLAAAARWRHWQSV